MGQSELGGDDRVRTVSPREENSGVLLASMTHGAQSVPPNSLCWAYHQPFQDHPGHAALNQAPLPCCSPCPTQKARHRESHIVRLFLLQISSFQRVLGLILLLT